MPDTPNGNAGSHAQSSQDSVQNSEPKQSSNGRATVSAVNADDGTALFDRLSNTPNYDFEALAAYFDAQSSEKNNTLTAQQIADNWARVRAYTNAMLMDGVADDMGAANAWGSQNLSGNIADGEWSMPVRATVGINDVSAANLRQLEGIKGAIRALG